MKEADHAAQVGEGKGKGESEAQSKTGVATRAKQSGRRGEKGGFNGKQEKSEVE